MHNVLITGASRGLGLGLTRAYLASGARVFAVLRRQPSDELLALSHRYNATLQLILCDLDHDQAAAHIGETLQGARLDRAVFNAGIYGPAHQDPRQVNREEIAQLFLGNAIAPVRLAQTLLSSISEDGVLAFISSQMASVELARAQEMALYGASKAALNSLLRSWSMAADFPPVTLLALHPGWVRTELGGADAPLSVEDSVRGLVDVIEAETGQPGCRFLDHQGLVLPW
jgi:NAD(P)-dependent dehydrogenase (short-subunit alcohol dehydrogenase family)